MKVVVVFDASFDWSTDQHAAQMAKEIANRANAEPEMHYQIGNSLQKQGHEVFFFGITDDPHAMSTKLAEWKPDLVFNATEAFLDNSNLDYLVPALLEAEGYRYTGAPPLALLVTRNKAMSKKILAFHNVKVPGFQSFRPGEAPNEKTSLRFPVIVKPQSADASEGISQASIVADMKALADRVAWIHERFDQPAIAEEYIEGRELYATMIGNGDKVEVLPIVEMVFDQAGSRPQDRIATRKSKWDLDYRKRRGIRNVFARKLSKVAHERLMHTCHAAYRAFWLRDYARIDVRLTKDGEVWFIEANANPFLSYGHDSAEAAHKAGLRYDLFIQRIVDDAMSRPA